MDLENKYKCFISEESVKILESRPTLKRLFFINSKISIHTNISKNNNIEAIPINNKSERIVSNSNNSNIYDVNATTKSLNTTQKMKLIDESTDDIVKCFENSTLNLLRKVSDKSKDMMLRVMRVMIGCKES